MGALTECTVIYILCKLSHLLAHSSAEEFTKLCEDELHLLEMCLRVNPKSYGIWLHREWVMTSTPTPDWKNEKRLCDLFLNYDERNCKLHTFLTLQHVHCNCKFSRVIRDCASMSTYMYAHTL